MRFVNVTVVKDLGFDIGPLAWSTSTILPLCLPESGCAPSLRYFFADYNASSTTARSRQPSPPKERRPSMTSAELKSELALLRIMTTGELRAKYLEVFGEASPSRHRERLVRRIAWKIQALAEGDLSERARRRAEEIANDADLRIRVPIVKATAPDADKSVGTLTATTIAQRKLPTAGTVITKDYHGRQLRVMVRENGFEFENQRFGSLSAVARHITGTQWNGNRFFGVVGKGGDK
ncbi:MAG: DUF2924 domain-containing protein [Chthoniobacteraceae bacterium]